MAPDGAQARSGQPGPTESLKDSRLIESWPMRKVTFSHVLPQNVTSERQAEEQRSASENKQEEKTVLLHVVV